ncbi:unnamed protein product [Arabis nemorensis]|uniref:MBD domain-containing protein n=1 Tax=Arabis nemorensis TaxID=586526 RepID=A0A565AZE0_9BRAS|nr:unnamed protein product [Arabis nemorensis]
MSNTNSTDQAQPQPENTAHPVESRPRKRASPAGDNWLPPGWRTEAKTRTSGTKAGVVDKFYFEPSGRKFRSKNEVLYYLEHGTPKKPGKKAENSDMSSEHSEGQVSNKRQNKSNQTANEQPPPPPKPLNFDFLNVPEKVIWTGTNGSEEDWWPVIGDYKIEEPVSEDWHRAFTLVTAPRDGKATF